MFFKLFENFIFSPYPLLFVTGFLLYWLVKNRVSNWGLRVCVGILLIHIALFCRIALALVSLPLESWISENSDERAEAIVVHGSSAHRIGAPTSGSAERGYLGAEVFLDGRAPLLLLMGYSPTDSLGSAKAMRMIALGMGVPASHTLMVSGRTTYEEAQLGIKDLRKRGINTIILVTSWYHVPRARAIWQKQGFEVITHTYLPKMNIWKNFLDWRNIQQLRWVCHEYAGFAIYWMRGWV